MCYLFNHSGHIRLYMKFKFAQKISFKCIQKITVGNGQITHNFFDFQKFCGDLAFFAFIAGRIQDNAC